MISVDMVTDRLLAPESPGPQQAGLRAAAVMMELLAHGLAVQLVLVEINAGGPTVLSVPILVLILVLGVYLLEEAAASMYVTILLFTNAAAAETRRGSLGDLAWLGRVVEAEVEGD